jgi:heme O synthase-like polyprenyltransferase
MQDALMSNTNPAVNEYFEFSKVSRLTTRQTVYLILIVIFASAIGFYFDHSYSSLLVFIPYFAFASWCDFSGISLKNTPRLKVLLFTLSIVYLAACMFLVLANRETGWFFSHVVKYFF